MGVGDDGGDGINGFIKDDGGCGEVWCEAC